VINGIFVKMNRDPRRILSLVVLATLLSPVQLLAQQLSASQSQNTSQLSGSIRSADGKAIPGVKVLVYHLSTEQLFTSEPTGSGGDYKILELPYGYFDVAVETPEGVYVADQVVNLPPSGKLSASLQLAPYADTGAQSPREFSGSNLESVGWARVNEKARGKAFWKSTAGIAILAGVGGVALLALALTSDDESDSSPIAP
jgi:hypothetical protein